MHSGGRRIAAVLLQVFAKGGPGLLWDLENSVAWEVWSWSRQDGKQLVRRGGRGEPCRQTELEGRNGRPEFILLYCSLHGVGYANISGCYFFQTLSLPPPPCLGHQQPLHETICFPFADHWGSVLSPLSVVLLRLGNPRCCVF